MIIGSWAVILTYREHHPEVPRLPGRSVWITLRTPTTPDRKTLESCSRGIVQLFESIPAGRHCRSFTSPIHSLLAVSSLPPLTPTDNAGQLTPADTRIRSP